MEPLDPRISRYFDHAATTPVDPRVLEAMMPFLRDDFGNAHSIHRWGARARAAVERAREQVSAVFGCEPSCVYFTSGATEANNWVLRQFQSGVFSACEHSAVREPAIAQGFAEWPFLNLKPAPPPESGVGPFEVQSLMAVNNEVGTRWDPRHDMGGRKTHCDAVQAVGRIDLRALKAEYFVASAHKIYGPKGVGALVSEEPLEPLLRGGEQESGLRGGTLNVPAIIGFGAAAVLSHELREEDWQRAERLRCRILDELQSLSDWQINGVPENPTEWVGHVPHILSLSFLGFEGETLVIEADAAGYAISAGAACSSRSTEPSHVLLALGIAPEWIRGTVRISFGRTNTDESAAGLGKALHDAVRRLRRLQ